MTFWVAKKIPGSAAGDLCKKSIDVVKGDLPMAPGRSSEIPARKTHLGMCKKKPYK